MVVYYFASLISLLGHKTNAERRSGGSRRVGCGGMAVVPCNIGLHVVPLSNVVR